ncbi:B-cell CLL/lymphoma 6 member B protein-like [Pollicipes pollicipes]|uniref:B-cell CLL/lymphoma 6 member B protein-like n=1 Tax=Pollicipes pollicipes TaxID=41117 RepID=UPI001884BBEB|nr:B-cell CLL/lymphoma 6 member B protein-like [Pollicipes pollicipes]
MSAARADQQFCLRWNSFQSNMASSLQLLRSEEDLVDVTLAAEGQLIKAHRLILSACSPLFKQILKDSPCHHPVVVLNEVRAAHVRGILSFMYQGQVNLTPDQMPEFLRAAQALHVKGLFEDMAELPPEGKENVPLPRPPPPPPPLLDTRLATKRAECVTDPPASGPEVGPEAGPEAGLPTLAGRADPAPRVSTELVDKSKHVPVTSAAASQASSSDTDYVITHTTYPFPCPFCEKSYTSWGFRRRHIKAFHTAGPTLKCKWCWKVLPSHDAWCAHVTREHHLSAADAQQAIQILDEANMVLQSSEPLRLDSLVDMVKRQQRRAATGSPEAALG